MAEIIRGKILKRMNVKQMRVLIIASILLPLITPDICEALESRAQSNGVLLSHIEDAYILGAGDRLRVEVFELPHYSGEFEVLVDGVISLPVVGPLIVEGLTIESATNRIREHYSEILQDSQNVTVSLVSHRSVQIGISGEIYHPGAYSLAVSNAEFPRLTEILELAGGIRMSADISQIAIQRKHSFGNRVIYVDLLQLLQLGDLSADVTLRDGDIINIPAASEVDFAVLSSLASASFTSAERTAINVAVVGEVFRPGPHVVTDSAQTAEAGSVGQSGNTGRTPTVTRAIQVAGGIRPMAHIREIEVHRPTRTGTTQILTVDLWSLLEDGNLEQDIALQEGDTVFVPTTSELTIAEATQLTTASFSPDSIQVNVVGEVERPGILSVAPNTPLNQTLLAAGSFNSRARRQSVKLIRLNLDGTVLTKVISVDLTQEVDVDENPILQNNDVIIVGRSAIARLSDNLATIGEPIGRFINLVTTPFTLLRLLD